MLLMLKANHFYLGDGTRLHHQPQGESLLVRVMEVGKAFGSGCLHSCLQPTHNTTTAPAPASHWPSAAPVTNNTHVPYDAKAFPRADMSRSHLQQCRLSVTTTHKTTGF